MHLELPSPLAVTDIFDTPSLLSGYENRPFNNAGEYHQRHVTQCEPTPVLSP